MGMLPSKMGIYDMGDGGDGCDGHFPKEKDLKIKYK
jgi:hypothetical protein